MTDITVRRIIRYYAGNGQVVTWNIPEGPLVFVATDFNVVVFPASDWAGDSYYHFNPRHARRLAKYEYQVASGQQTFRIDPPLPANMMMMVMYAYRSDYEQASQSQEKE